MPSGLELILQAVQLTARAPGNPRRTWPHRAPSASSLSRTRNAMCSSALAWSTTKL